MIIPEKEERHWIETFENPRPVVSVLNNREKLAFHVLAEIQNKTIKTQEDLLRWYRRSLTCRQGAGPFSETEAQNVLADLKQMNMITEEDDGFHVTPLGVVSAMMYYHPYDIYAWHGNFSTIVQNNLISNPAALAWAIADIPSNKFDYLPKGLQHLEQQWNDGLRFLNKRLDPSTVLWVEAVFNCLKNADAKGIVRSKMWLFRNDASRIVSTFRMIDRDCAFWHLALLWNFLEEQFDTKDKPSAAFMDEQILKDEEPDYHEHEGDFTDEYLDSCRDDERYYSANDDDTVDESHTLSTSRGHDEDDDHDFYDDCDTGEPYGYEDEQERLRDIYGEGGFETDDGNFFPESWDPS
jgi:hypothetical protein